jgi:hypothetical protein
LRKKDIQYQGISQNVLAAPLVLVAPSEIPIQALIMPEPMDKSGTFGGT